MTSSDIAPSAPTFDFDGDEPSDDAYYLDIGHRADASAIEEYGVPDEDHERCAVMMGALDGHHLDFFRDLVHRYGFGADNAVVAALRRDEHDLAVEMISSAVDDPLSDLEMMNTAGAEHGFPVIGVFAAIAAERWSREADPHSPMPNMLVDEPAEAVDDVGEADARSEGALAL